MFFGPGWPIDVIASVIVIRKRSATSTSEILGGWGLLHTKIVVTVDSLLGMHVWTV